MPEYFPGINFQKGITFWGSGGKRTAYYILRHFDSRKFSSLSYELDLEAESLQRQEETAKFEKKLWLQTDRRTSEENSLIR